MRFARLLIVGLLMVSGAAFGGESDGPYILVYYDFPTSNITLATVDVIYNCAPYCGGINQLIRGESGRYARVEKFRTLKEAFERLNTREASWLSGHPERPAIAAEDLIGFFKGEQLPIKVQDSGKTVKITHQVEKTEDVPLQNWYWDTSK